MGSLDRRVENREDDALTEATDDPVRDAFEHLRGPGQVIDEEDDMEEQIVWNPRLLLIILRTIETLITLLAGRTFHHLCRRTFHYSQEHLLRTYRLLPMHHRAP